MLVIVYFLLFFIVSIAMSDYVFSYAMRRFNIIIPEHLHLAIVLHLIPMFGYGLYWCYHLSPFIGSILSYVLTIAGLAYVIRTIRKQWRLPGMTLKETKIQAAMISGYVVCVTCVAAALPLAKDDNMNYTAPTIFSYNMFKLPDGSQYDTLTQLLYARKDVSPYNVSGDPYKTTLTDRPPVIGGSPFLLKEPKAFFKPKGLRSYYGMAYFTELWYTAVGMTICTAWISALWGLFRSLGVEPSRAVLIIAAAGTTNWFLFNSFYFWPRMLTSSYELLAIVCYDPIFNNRRNLRGKAEWLFPALFLSFALLTHLASMLGMFLWGLTLLVRRQMNIKHVVLWAAMALALISTWYIPKKMHEEWHPSMFRFLLADRDNQRIYSNESISDLEAVIESYKGMPAGTIFNGKLLAMKWGLPGAAEFNKQPGLSRNWYLMPSFKIIIFGALGWLWIGWQHWAKGARLLSTEMKTFAGVTLFSTLSLWLFYFIVPYKLPIYSNTGEPLINTLYVLIFLIPLVYLPSALCLYGVFFAIGAAYANLTGLYPVYLALAYWWIVFICDRIRCLPAPYGQYCESSNQREDLAIYKKEAGAEK